MKTIIHISDLHFGRSSTALVAPLLHIIKERKPDLVIISGDFTQRAKQSEFEQAREFLKAIPFPLLVVPGNHDIPLYNFWQRLVNPYRKYRQYISPHLEPIYQDDEIAVKAINSVTRLKWKEGRVTLSQLAEAEHLFSAVPKNLVKIIVTHHPFNVLMNFHGKPLKRAQIALDEFEKIGVDLVLAGHLHSSMQDPENAVYQIKHRGPVVVQAGTAISTRLRAEPNSFNIITVDSPAITVERFSNTAAGQFTQISKKSFIRQSRSLS